MTPWPHERYGPAPVPADRQQYGHEGRHHGTGAPGCPVELHHHHDERCERVPVTVTAVEIVDGVEVPIGEPRQTTASRGALDLLHGQADVEAELRRIADETGESIETVRDLHEAMQACGAEGDDAARVERRQSAREAYYDACAAGVGRVEGSAIALEAALETATRVRVDADVTQAVREAHPDLMIKTTELKGMIEVAFRAAGFEVEQ